MSDWNRFIVGDAAAQLRHLPAQSVDTCITSPPYLLLRDYGVPGQLGMEANADEWAAQLLVVLRELARVLKPTGSLWLNVGDSYAKHPRHGAPPKSLLLAPERLLLGLLADGWVVRNRVVWQKSNPRPCSARDRLTCTWEPIYLLVRSRHYYFDLDVIRRRHRTRGRQQAGLGLRAGIDPTRGTRGPLAGTTTGLDRLKILGRPGHPLGANPGDVLTTAASSYRGAHCATFPISLVRPLLRATCPEKTCVNCGRPWQREPARQLGGLALVGQLRPACDCRAGAVPGLVLDPFSGAGTVPVVAQAHGRRWLGIDINPAYVRLAERRVEEARQHLRPQSA